MCTERQHRVRSSVSHRVHNSGQGATNQSLRGGIKYTSSESFWRSIFLLRRQQGGDTSMSTATETPPVIKILVVGDAGVGKTSVIHR